MFFTRSAKETDDLVGQGHEGLKRLPDAELVAAYEAIRDRVEQSERGPTYPGVGRVHATAFEREKDRREAWAWSGRGKPSEAHRFYEEAVRQPCTWWVRNHLVAKHALTSCMYCGVCTSQCPAARLHEEYNPRQIVDVVLNGEEEPLVELLRSETLWYCGQCGSCRPRCPRDNNLMGLVSSLRYLAQLKGYHLTSTRGRQQYAARHLWGANFWNRACSLYFRNAAPDTHPDFGPRWADWFEHIEDNMALVGAHPETTGLFGGRKTAPETLHELRRCVQVGGTLVLWNRLEEAAFEDARRRGLGIDAYHDLVRSEG